MSTMAEESPLQSPAMQSPQCQPSQFFERVSKHGIYRTVRIRVDFATISSRIETLRDWPHTTLPPWEIALAGFYHDPAEEDPTTVTCFSCDAVWPNRRPTGRYSKKEVQTILLDFHLDNCFWADMLRNAMGQHLINPLGNTTTEDREHYLEYVKQCDKINNDKSSFSLQINRVRKGDLKEQLLILEATSVLLSGNCEFSFTCNN